MKFLNYGNKTKKNYAVKRNTNYINYLSFFYYRDLSLRAGKNIINYFTYSNNVTNATKHGVTSSRIRNLANFFFSHGNLMKSTISLFNVFSKLYLLFYSKNNSLISKNYKYFKEFFYNFSIYRTYNNLNYLNDWLVNWNELIFTIECTVVPKKYRKKLKKKYLYKVKYLNKSKRLNKIFNWLSKYSNSIKNFNHTNRLLLVYLDTVLNYKNSYIYNKKLLVYKKIFRI